MQYFNLLTLSIVLFTYDILKLSKVKQSGRFLMIFLYAICIILSLLLHVLQ